MSLNHFWVLTNVLHQVFRLFDYTMQGSPQGFEMRDKLAKIAKNCTKIEKSAKIAKNCMKIKDNTDNTVFIITTVLLLLLYYPKNTKIKNILGNLE